MKIGENWLKLVKHIEENLNNGEKTIKNCEKEVNIGEKL